MSDCLFTDNVLMAFETMHYLNQKKKGKIGKMALKLDMSKAFNQVEWGYLQARMHGRGKMAAAPASDGARRGDARGTPLPARRTASSFFFFVSGFVSTRAEPDRFVPIRAESDCIDRIPVCSIGKRKSAGEKKKKKNLKPKIPMDLICRCRHFHWA